MISRHDFSPLPAIATDGGRHRVAFAFWRRRRRWEGHPWSLLLTPGWRKLIGRPLPEIAARQWIAATEFVLRDLEALPRESWCVASYDRLIANPQEEVERLCAYAGIAWDRELTSRCCPESRTPICWSRALRW